MLGPQESLEAAPKGRASVLALGGVRKVWVRSCSNGYIEGKNKGWLGETKTNKVRTPHSFAAVALHRSVSGSSKEQQIAPASGRRLDRQRLTEN